MDKKYYSPFQTTYWHPRFTAVDTCGMQFAQSKHNAMLA
jgi:hypothetical protein